MLNLGHSETPALAAPPLLSFERTALFLDLDGTLAPIELRPEAVGPDPRRTALLRRLDRALEGRLAVVSGRDLEAIDRILEGAVRCAAGVHGLERRGGSGEVVRFAPHPGLARARAAFGALAARRPGVLVEDKGLSVALHYRLAPEAEAEALREARQVAQLAGLALQPGDMVVELRTPGVDKGGAIQAFLSEPAFADARPVFLGDDLTDEAGFAVIRPLGGLGILIGPERHTAASSRLDGVPAVLDWLEASLTAATL